MSWTMAPKLGCPNVPEHGEIEGIALKIDFIFAEGERHRTAETWILSCGCELSGYLVEWDADEDADGVMWAILADAQTHEPVLVWSDGRSDHITAESEEDYEDSEHELDT